MTLQHKENDTTEAQILLETLNNARTTSNLAELKSSKLLESHALTHAVELSKERKLRPSTTELQIPHGENLHRCRKDPAADAFISWCKKSYASANIFSTHARFTGIAIVNDHEYYYVVMMITKNDPEPQSIGTDASCTFVSAVLLSERDAVTKTEWSNDVDGIVLETPTSEKEKQPIDPISTISEMRALDIAHDAFNYMNGARRDAHVDYLRWDQGLYQHALRHTQNLFKLGRLLHSGKQRFENVAMIDLTSTHNPGKLLTEKFSRRRENMLSTSFDYCAIAVVADQQKAYATQLFSRERALI